MNKYKSRKDVPDKYKWNLTDIFKDEKEFEKSYKEVESDIKRIKDYIGCTKDSKRLLEFLRTSIEFDIRLENLLLYAFLKSDEELGVKENLERSNKVELLCSTYSGYTSFFKPELLSLSKEEYSKLFDNKDLNEFRFMLDDMYKDKEHSLNENEEKIVIDLMTAVGDMEEISSSMVNSEHDYGTVNIDGDETVITSTNTRKLLKNKDSKIRKEVYDKVKGMRSRYAGTSASLLNSYVKTNNALSKIHKFNSAWESKLHDYNMPEEAYNTLINVVENNIDKYQKYFKMFKEELGLKELQQYDLNLDITSSDKKYTIEEGQDLIREALKPLGEDYIKHFNKIIDNRYIDYCEYKGKQSGGYSAGSIDHDSRILLSFNEDLDSVSVVAHECGHNVHGQFVKENNPPQYRNITRLVCEVASLTNECLLSSYLANNGKTKEEKLAGIDNILGVILGNLFGSVREGIMEKELYKYSLGGNALTKEYLNETNLNLLKKFYGDTVIFNEFSGSGWIGIYHFFANFYFFDYAFCISAACANAKRILSGDKNALDRYINFLKIGSDKYPYDAFKELGFDLTDAKVYEDAIKYFDSLLDKYKEISKGE